MSQDFFLQFIPGAEPEPEQAPDPSRNPSFGSVLTQFGSGANEGLAGMLGLPVDAVTSIINGIAQQPAYISQGVDPETGRPLPLVPNENRQPAIQRPVGGAASLTDAMSPFITDEAPEGAWERYARRIGQDVGASILPVGIAARGAQAPLGLLAMEGASSVGSGVGGQVAEDLGGGPVAQFLASIAGGSAPIAASRLARTPPQAPTAGELEQQTQDIYHRRDSVQDALTPQQRQDLLDRIRQQVEPATPLQGRQTPATVQFLGSMGDEAAGGLPNAATPRDLHDFRRAIASDVTSGVGDRRPEVRSGQMMQDVLDRFMREAADDPASPPGLRQGLLETFEGNAVNRRAEALNTLTSDTGLLTNATRRAARTGTGGNVLNTIRQNISRILDNERLRRGYTDDELQIMEDIVAGTRGENLLRSVGRLSPTTGGLQMMAGIGGPTLAAATGSSAATSAALAPFAVGYTAQQMAEAMAQRRVQGLLDVIANGGPLPGRGVTDTELRALVTNAAGSIPGLLQPAE
jgi:hypothetical protein